MKISRMKMTMLFLLSLCLIVNINASSNGDDYFVFDKAERAVGYKQVGGGIGANRGSNGIIRGSRGTNGVGTSKSRSVGGGRSFSLGLYAPPVVQNIPREQAHGSGYLHTAAIPYHFDFLGHFRYFIRPVTEGGYKRGGSKYRGGGGGAIAASRGGIAASHGHGSM
ncbi:hypothetical protein CTI12_AA159040 [Artemisia annua]|uniref:Glycine-rich protein n=1 Tax=Artemisia annua TaxID=35608 RepID=A0A2U1PEZ8_ARTAN|nr:hypothetical protein CTI12_AA159040 [Artemisia annua]